MQEPLTPPSEDRAALQLRLGRLIELHATGWAVLAAPLVLVLLLAAVVASWILR